MTVWPVSDLIMNAIAAGPGFPLAPPSEKTMSCLTIVHPSPARLVSSYMQDTFLTFLPRAGGCPPGTEVKINAERLYHGEQTLLGTFYTTPLHSRKALNRIASRTIDARPLVKRKMKLEQIKEAFEALSTSKTEL